MNGRRTCLLVSGAVTALLALSACGDENHYVAPPPPKVTVAAPTKQAVTRYLELTGNTAAVNSADLVARVSGFVQDIQYQDGAIVKKGTPLFTIEPQPYDVKLKQAQAAEAGAQATLKQAQAEYDRQSALVASQTVSRSSFDQATANRDAAQGTYDQAHANTQLAQLNYDYAHVTAPFDGVVMARQVSVGQFVGGSGTPTVLATIVQVDPIYVNFNISERDVLRLRDVMAKRGMNRDDLMQVPVEVGLQSETGYPHAGHFNYAAPMLNSVDRDAGGARDLRQQGSRAAARLFRPRADSGRRPGRRAAGAGRGARQRPGRALSARRQQGQRGRAAQGQDRPVGRRDAGDRRRAEGRRSVVVAGVLRAIPGQKVDPQVAGCGQRANSG